MRCIECLFQVLFKPSTDGWLKIANKFEAKWQMPHYVGALDGKHIVHQVCNYLRIEIIYFKYNMSCVLGYCKEWYHKFQS